MRFGARHAPALYCGAIRSGDSGRCACSSFILAIKCCAKELNQVFMKLIIDTVQAIPEKGDIGIRSGAG